MKRIYHDPPMKFNVGWKTFEVDLPKKRLGHEQFSTEKQISMALWFILSLFVLAIGIAIYSMLTQ